MTRHPPFAAARFPGPGSVLASPVVIGASLLLLASCGSGGGSDPRNLPPLVRTLAAAPATGGSDRLSGVVRARVEADLGFRVGGKVAQRLADLGSHVRKGQVLARLDGEDYALALTAAEAQ